MIICDPYYQSIIQKQVTTFYESAEIEEIPPKKRMNLKASSKDYVNGYYMHLAEDFWYPIQTYKQIEDDAMNNLANSFSKLANIALIAGWVRPRTRPASDTEPL